jgi:type II secretory pathway component PulL
MSKRFIGIDIAADTLHIAIADGDKKHVQLQQVTSHPLTEHDALPKLLAGVLGPVAGFGDRLITALPVRHCYLRWLNFPFRDTKKLASAIELELSVQLPIDIEQHQLVHRSRLDPEQTGEIIAAAVPNQLLDETLARFDETSWPAHLVDLTPFALAAGLSGCRDGDLLIVADEHETTVCSLHQRTPDNLAVLPATADQSAAEVTVFVSRQARMLLGAGEAGSIRTWLIAPRHAENLQQELQQLGFQVAIPTVPGHPTAASLPGLKAALLALCAANQDKQQGFNLRQGPFALRGEWQKLRRSFIAVALLAGLLIASWGTSSWLKHSELKGQADQLSHQMEQVFRANFSKSDPIIDIPRQIEVKLAEMRRKTELLGLSSQGSALRVLEEISSRLPADLPIEIKELNYSADNLRLSGFTRSFDAVNQAADKLKASPLFAEAKIADAKLSLDGSRVDFQLQLNYRSGGTQ